MKKAFKRVTAAVCAAATVAALSIPSYAEDFDLPETRFFSERVPMEESSYANMNMQAGTYGLAVLKSDYSVTRDRYSLTTHYACPKNGFQYRFAYAFVCNKDGESLWKSKKHSDQDEAIAVYTDLYNKKFSEEIAFTKSLGLCSSNDKKPTIGLTADLNMDFKFIFKDIQIDTTPEPF